MNRGFAWSYAPVPTQVLQPLQYLQLQGRARHVWRNYWGTCGTPARAEKSTGETVKQWDFVVGSIAGVYEMRISKGARELVIGRAKRGADTQEQECSCACQDRKME